MHRNDEFLRRCRYKVVRSFIAIDHMEWLSFKTSYEFYDANIFNRCVLAALKKVGAPYFDLGICVCSSVGQLVGIVSCIIMLTLFELNIRYDHMPRPIY